MKLSSSRPYSSRWLRTSSLIIIMPMEKRALCSSVSTRRHGCPLASDGIIQVERIVFFISVSTPSIERSRIFPLGKPSKFLSSISTLRSKIRLLSLLDLVEREAVCAGRVNDLVDGFAEKKGNLPLKFLKTARILRIAFSSRSISSESGFPFPGRPGSLSRLLDRFVVICI